MCFLSSICLFYSVRRFVVCEREPIELNLLFVRRRRSSMDCILLCAPMMMVCLCLYDAVTREIIINYKEMKFERARRRSGALCPLEYKHFEYLEEKKTLRT